jgi:hypothetical protein
MNIKNTKKLYKDFPKLYRQHKLPMDQTCMCWGFECGDGWFDLLYDLSKKISEVDPKCEVTQVKEKFGTLSFYVSSASDEVYKLIDKAEKKSGKICDLCGEKGKIRDKYGWLMALCNKCWATEKKK